MNTHREENRNLLEQLAYFTGTEKYHRIAPTVVLTDGAVFLAEQAGAFWLFDLYHSHLACSIDKAEEFTVLTLTVNNHTAKR